METNCHSTAHWFCPKYSSSRYAYSYTLSFHSPNVHTHHTFTQYNISLQSTPHYVFSVTNDPHFLYPTKRDAILQSYRLQDKTKAATLLYTFLHQEEKKEQKEKLGQQQLNSQISGFVKAEKVCSWGNEKRQAPCSSVREQRLPTLLCSFFCISPAWRCRSRLSNYPLIEYS